MSDPAGHSDTTSLTVTAGTPPTASILSPAAGTTWKVGDTLSFSGSGTDFLGHALPASALSWQINLQHCNRTNSTCHTHVIQTINGVSSGSVSAPDHAYPCWLELQLTATDSGGLTSTTSVRLDPKTVVLTFKTNPGGLVLSDGFLVGLRLVVL